jgi:hypothetical protein
LHENLIRVTVKSDEKMLDNGFSSLRALNTSVSLPLRTKVKT